MNEARDLMQVMLRGIVADTLLANEIAGLADLLEGEGFTGEAAGMRTIMRHHRVRMLELKGQLAALMERYGPLLDAE